MPLTRCFFVEPVGEAAVYLRRYSSGSTCSSSMGYHNAMTYLATQPVVVDASGFWDVAKMGISHSYSAWPSRCDCGYEFQPEDSWQEFSDRMYSDGHTSWPKRELPVGSLFYENWLPRNMYWDNKEDGHLHVVTPGGTWNIDGRASNCTMPNDRLHRCWVRHGEPSHLHVDKQGHTCNAGAGSIWCGSYHGFLHDGYLS